MSQAHGGADESVGRVVGLAHVAPALETYIITWSLGLLPLPVTNFFTSGARGSSHLKPSK